MKRETIVSFMLGFFSCAIIFFLVSGIFQMTGLIIQNPESPSDHLNETNILLYQDRIIIEISNATISSYADTGSMEPLFDSTASGIRIKPSSADQILVGDIISFRGSSGDLLVHRVIEKGIDSEGVYFITKGDRNIFTDEKIRFEEIEYLTIGVLW